MKLGTEVDLGADDIVLDGDPAPPPKKRHSIPCQFWPIYCGQTAALIEIPVCHVRHLVYGVGLGPGHIVLHEDPAPPKRHSSPQFWPMPLLQNGWMDKDATWCEDGPRFWSHYVRWGPTHPPKRWRHSPFPNFRPMSVVPKRMDGSRYHLVGR